MNASNERHDARISELMNQMATNDERANETISQLQSKLDNQNAEMLRRNDRYDAKVSELMNQMATNDERANETISQLQSKLNNQCTEIKEISQKLEILNFYNQVSRTNSRIKNGYSWQQICSGSHLNESDLQGILKYLISESHGDIVENGTIKIISSDKSDLLPPENCVKFDRSYFYSTSGNDYIIFDFVNRKIHVDYYLISSSYDMFLTNWRLEGSNDRSKWDTIDIRNEDKALSSANIRCIFKASCRIENIYRYIKFYSTSGESFDIQFIEFYGTLYEPK